MDLLQAVPFLLLLLATSLLDLPIASLSLPTALPSSLPARVLSQAARPRPVLKAEAPIPPPPPKSDPTQLALFQLKQKLRICDTAELASAEDATPEVVAAFLPSWRLGTRLSAWEGVTQNAEGQVAGITISNSDGLPEALCFAFPDAWTTLTTLKNIQVLCTGCISGSLPAAWSVHPALQNVTVVDQNWLQGPLPDTWSTLTHLTALRVGDNQLTGTLPPSWSTLSNLQALLVYNNYLGGSLPDTWSTLTSLSSLRLDINSLTGSLPTPWQKLSSLTVFNATSNYLSGSLPPAWSKLERLSALGAANNAIHGSLPASWSALSSLARLELDYNYLDGTLPSQWDALLALSHLGLAGNFFSGPVPTGWPITWISDNLTSTDSTPSGIGEEITKRVLLYYKVKTTLQVNGGGYKTAGASCSSAAVELWDEGTDLALWPGLQVERAPATGTGSAQQAKLIGLTLNSSSLCGQLPSSWSFLTDLKILDLSNNSFIGGVPDSWSTLQKLTVLNMSRNAISSTIPQNLSSLSRLVHLDMSVNQLTGPVPGNLSSMKKLQHVDFSRNSLQGSLTQEWTALADLVHLDLSENALTGQLPMAWSRLTRLTFLSLRSAHANNIGIEQPGSRPMSYGSNRSGALYAVVPGALLAPGGQGADHVYVAAPAGPAGSTSVGGSSVASPRSSLNVGNQGMVQGLKVKQKAAQQQTGGSTAVGGLTGSLPSAWRNMSNLQVLELSGNEFSGSLPVEWSGLSNLVKLGLEWNNLTGPLPWEWRSLEKLTYLALGWNRFDGVLPVAWGTLSSLQLLGLQGNNLEGGIPAGWSGLSQLTQLELAQNKLNGTLEAVLSNALHVMHLDLHANMFEGPLPSSWGSSLGNLTHLDLSQNNLSSSIPPDWSKLSRLSVLNVAANFLTGEVPSWASSLAFLTQLDLSSNSLEGSLSPALSALKQLQRLSLAGNRIVGPLAVEWSALVNLTILDVSNCSLTGPLPPQWSQLTRLQVLNVSNNFLQGTLPSSWGGALFKVEVVQPGTILSPAWPAVPQTAPGGDSLSSRQPSNSAALILDLSNNSVSGDLPGSWANMSSLSLLNLSRNQIKGPLPASLSELPAVSHVDLSHNQFSGALPLSWSALTSLTLLSLSNNSLTGSLPDPWSTLMPNLRALSLDHNKLTASIPNNWTACDALCSSNRRSTTSEPPTPDSMTNDTSTPKSNNSFTNTSTAVPVAKWDQTLYVDISFNQLTGLLPPLPSLAKYFDASFNNFSGTIAYVSPSLIYLNLANNSLTGSIPVINSSSLIYLNLAANSLTTLPDTLIAPQLLYISLSNNSLSGTIPPLKNDSSYAQSIMVEAPADSAGLGAATQQTGSTDRDEMARAYVMDSVQYVDLGSNDLSGTIHASWFQHDYMKLSFDNNRLNGPLPSVWAGSFNLLQLQNNFLTGCVPLEWPANNTLLVLSLHNNTLSCALPSNWGQQPSGPAGADVSRTGASADSSTTTRGSFRNLVLLDVHESGLKGPIPFSWLQHDSFGPDTVLRLGQLWADSSRQTAWRQHLCLHYGRPVKVLRPSIALQGLEDSLQQKLMSALSNSVPRHLLLVHSGSIRIGMYPSELFDTSVREQSAPTMYDICVNPRAKIIVIAQWCGLGVLLIALFLAYLVVASCRGPDRYRTYCCSGFPSSKGVPDLPIHGTETKPPGPVAEAAEGGDFPTNGTKLRPPGSVVKSFDKVKSLTGGAGPRRPGPIAEAFDGADFGYHGDHDDDDISTEDTIQRYARSPARNRPGLDDVEYCSTGGPRVRVPRLPTAPFVLNQQSASSGRTWLGWLLYCVHVATYWFDVGSSTYLLATLLSQTLMWWVLYLLLVIIAVNYVMASSLLAWHWHRPKSSAHPGLTSHPSLNHTHTSTQHLDSQSQAGVDSLQVQRSEASSFSAHCLWVVDALILLPVLPLVDVAFLLLSALQCLGVLPASTSSSTPGTRSHSHSIANKHSGRLRRIIAHWQVSLEMRTVWEVLLGSIPAAVLQSVIFMLSNMPQLAARVYIEERVYVISAVGSCWQILWVAGWLMLGAAFQDVALGGRVRAVMFGDSSSGRQSSRAVRSVAAQQVGLQLQNNGREGEGNIKRPAGIMAWD